MWSPGSRSTQKLPSRSVPIRDSPRTTAIGHGQPGRRREEVLDRETRHLHGVAGARLPGIRLPVRVRGERDSGVERGVPVHRAALAEREPWLEHEQREEPRDGHHRQGEHRQGVCRPPLLGVRVDPDNAVDHALDPPVLRVGEHAVHPRPERQMDQGEQDRDEPDGQNRLQEGVHAGLRTGPGGPTRRGGTR